MNLLVSYHSRRALKASPSPVFVPDELITEVLSRLTVKSLLRLRCVCKSWNLVISDPTFVKLHLNRSSQNGDFTFVYTDDDDDAYSSECSGVSFSVISLFENPPMIINLPKDPCYQLKDRNFHGVVGSCNGLLCLAGYSNVDGNRGTWFRFWNLATRTMSQRLGYFLHEYQNIDFHFTFGFDKLNNTYKVVGLLRTEVRVFSLQDNAWRNIQNHCKVDYCSMGVVYLNGSVNWLANQNYEYMMTSDKSLVIISLDLGTEAQTQLLPPHGFDPVLTMNADLSVLNDYLCFSHNFKQTHFVIWQMKEFGVEDSWTLFFKISYHILQVDYPLTGLLPLCLLVKNDVLLLTNKYKRETILYYPRDNRVQKIQRPWWFCAIYVESLVSYC